MPTYCTLVGEGELGFILGKGCARVDLEYPRFLHSLSAACLSRADGCLYVLRYELLSAPRARGLCVVVVSKVRVRRGNAASGSLRLSERSILFYPRLAQSCVCLNRAEPEAVKGLMSPCPEICRGDKPEPTPALNFPGTRAAWQKGRGRKGGEECVSPQETAYDFQASGKRYSILFMASGSLPSGLVMNLRPPWA